MYFAKAGFWTKNLVILSITVFCLHFPQAILEAIGNNFAIEEIGITGLEKGFLDSFREVPGMAMVLIAALTMRLAEPRLASFSLLIAGISFALYLKVQTVHQLIAVSMFWSLGFHIWIPLERSLTIGLGDRATSGRMLGLMAGVRAVSFLVAMGLVLLLVDRLGYRNLFFIGSLTLFLGILVILRLPSHIGQRRDFPRFVFKRRYTLYYWLTFLEGAPRQIFWTFAIFTLIKVYGMNVKVVTAILVVNSLVTTYLGPKIGYWIDTLGERKALSYGYGLMIFSFIGFALVHQVWFMVLMLFAYRVLQTFSMGISSYISRIAPSQDLSSSFAVGVTNSHLAALVIPVVGGFIWERFGYEFSFIFGALVTVIVFASVRMMPKELVPVGEASVQAKA